ncbi:hypothetical protein Bbelb_227280 [Branchiostoma belcheri]|nr:hypothetical protein Bbelb_227280 [Branchiostoma belcheri]
MCLTHSTLGPELVDQARPTHVTERAVPWGHVGPGAEELACLLKNLFVNSQHLEGPVKTLYLSLRGHVFVFHTCTGRSERENWPDTSEDTFKWIDPASSCTVRWRAVFAQRKRAPSGTTVKRAVSVYRRRNLSRCDQLPLTFVTVVPHNILHLGETTALRPHKHSTKAQVLNPGVRKSLEMSQPRNPLYGFPLQ